METDADRRFRHLAAAIAHDAKPDDIPELELDVRGRTSSYQERGEDGRPGTRHVAVLERRLQVTEGIGTGWCTLGVGRGVVPVPPWEARDDSPLPHEPLPRASRRERRRRRGR